MARAKIHSLSLDNWRRCAAISTISRCASGARRDQAAISSRFRPQPLQTPAASRIQILMQGEATGADWVEVEVMTLETWRHRSMGMAPLIFKRYCTALRQIPTLVTAFPRCPRFIPISAEAAASVNPTPLSLCGGFGGTTFAITGHPVTEEDQVKTPGSRCLCCAYIHLLPPSWPA